MTSDGSKIAQNDGDTEEMKVTQVAIFLSHVQKHGLTYAIVALLAQQMGLLDQLIAGVGGMC